MSRCRVRELGLKLGSMETGKHNAITDVEGVGVGHVTVTEGENVRTGVTAIAPHQGNLYEDKVTAAVDILNGYGKSVGLTQIVFEGVIETPIMLTETLNTYRVADAVIDYYPEGYGFTPGTVNAVVGETNGGYLTDNHQRNVNVEHVYEAITMARGNEGRGPVAEGNVGAGTPMTGYGFKGGIGTSSRVIGDATVGVLVQLNCGRKDDLTIAGVPVGKEVKLPEKPEKSPGNSIMMIVATDVEIDSRQLWKIAKRTTHGLARTGAYSGNSSGDFTIAFTTGKLKTEEYKDSVPELAGVKGDGFLSPLYKATVEATEESILNALCKAETMTGVNNHVRYALPLDQTKEILKRYNRL
ncbi:MAG: P1 family peptidase [Candidatus Bathyarchaeota archaeon]|nr:P1 family peptidase [Candidatus Bathyarchaeota archaeon]